MPDSKEHGKCCSCGHPISFILGEVHSPSRWYLQEPVVCGHCKQRLTAVLKDGYGRFWVRRRVFNE